MVIILFDNVYNYMKMRNKLSIYLSLMWTQFLGRQSDLIEESYGIRVANQCFPF